MLAVSPDKEATSAATNFSSASGVVHINSAQDWANFEAEDENDSDRSVEEILSTRCTRNGGRRRGNGPSASQATN